MSIKITFIGAGNMANSLAGGLVAKGYAPGDITLTDISEQQLQKRKNDLGVNTDTDNVSACSLADIVVLAVKPQVMQAVVAPLKTIINERAPLVISIAAGITIGNLEECLGKNTAIVRCMPNTPALVQTGATGLFANPKVTSTQKEQAKSILSAVGIALWVESEDQIDAVTAISGSGPAYFFLLMEAIMETGQKLGLSPETSSELTLQTALGAARMAIDSNVDTSELRHQVTSPGGTTERAINIMEDGGLRKLINEALTGAYQRSKELANS